jgi:Ribbon-helix-helix protein, copG family
MGRLSVRLTERMFWQLDALAAELGVTRTRLVRQLLEAGLRDGPEPLSEPPSEEELPARARETASSSWESVWNPPVSDSLANRPQTRLCERKVT